MSRKIELPAITPISELSPEAIQAAYELIAETLRRQAEVINVRLDDVSYDGQPLGAYEISIRRLL